MKRLLCTLLACTPLLLTAQQPSFSLQGSLKRITLPSDKIYLEFRNGKEWKKDSAVLTDGEYKFTGELTEPKLASLSVFQPEKDNSSRRMVMQVFLEPGLIRVIHTDSFSNGSVSGSKAHEDYLDLQRQAKPYLTQRDGLRGTYINARKAGDKDGMEAVEKQLEEVDRELRGRVYGAFVRESPASPTALYALTQFAGYDLEPGKVEPLFNLLPAATRNYPTAQDLNEKIIIAKKTAVGQVAMDFTQNDTLGNPVSLSSFRGKYLLVDFWASWCGPCRQENPNVVKAFETYSRKGFYILGVSLDRPNGREKWLKAINDDGLAWAHVSDLKFWENEVARQYGINAIPQNLLIDPNGKIIARNLRGEELQDKLREIFN
ncbi:TlpA disulfide reductase family protein [Flavihumibacter solisilvae]|uniref:Thioredoxin domain-containing protein n=1 Tax=Flavihumibacter solisilvae TaxID=1349421 RepID=A0A0C1LBD8_9BACT|nr:TlpA disulfide reductase family protein [Flavihumibacter solisilvae]KIC92843.1 hypothetical protein OI18_20710 [Flavihumibacter solisilvae]